MLRPVLFAAAVLALVAPARAVEPDLSGNWLITYTQRGGLEAAFAIIKIEMKNGKASAATIYTPLNGSRVDITGMETESDKSIKFRTRIHNSKDDSFKSWSFEGTLDVDGKTILGSITMDSGPNRARMARTDKTELATDEAFVRPTPPPSAAESQKLTVAVASLRNQIIREKDAEKRKELTEKASAAEKEADEKVPELLRETVVKHANSAFAYDAAMDLLRGAAKFKVTPDEAISLLAKIEKVAAPYGSKYLHTTIGDILNALAYQKGAEVTAIALAEHVNKTLTDKSPFQYQSQVLSAYQKALQALSTSDKDGTLKTITERLNKIEPKLDVEYASTVPPFKPAAFAGRKDKAANQVAVMELFTGAQCPPCVAADVAFDALGKTYKPTDLVLIQYHLHIPGPDPLTNTETVARARYYAANSTPTTLFNGKLLARGGGPMSYAESKYEQYAGIINPILENTTDVVVKGKASQTGEKVAIAVEVSGADGEDMKLRLVLVEETIKYVGGNQLRFHHQVVRAMPGGVDGVTIKDKAFKHAETVELPNIRKELTTYLDNFAQNRPFPKPQRPMDLKSLRVIALVQNDKTKEIVQAVQLEVDGKSTEGGRE